MTIDFKLKWKITMVVLLSWMSRVGGSCDYGPCIFNNQVVQHTMCAAPAELNRNVDMCNQPEAKVEMTSEMRDAILNRLNQHRSMVAQGKVANQPPAADMNKLTWDNEMEMFAERFLNSCPAIQVHIHLCNTAKDGKVVDSSQGFGIWNYGNPNKVAEVVRQVDSWFSQRKYVRPGYIDDARTILIAELDRVMWYLTIMKGNFVSMGCGFLEYNYNADRTTQNYMLMCDYKLGDSDIFKVYTRGKACSKCPSGAKCSKQYPGLCTTDKDDWQEDSDGKGSLQRAWAVSVIAASTLVCWLV